MKAEIYMGKTVMNLPKGMKDGGDCFMSAVYYMWNRETIEGDFRMNGELRLVHGVVVYKGYAHIHAWCEDDVMAYDYSNGNCVALPKHLYRLMGGVSIIDVRAYTRRHMNKMLLETGHFGEWDSQLQELANKYNQQNNSNTQK